MVKAPKQERQGIGLYREIWYNSEDLLVTKLPTIKAARETKLRYIGITTSHSYVIPYQFQNTFVYYCFQLLLQ